MGRRRVEEAGAHRRRGEQPHRYRQGRGLNLLHRASDWLRRESAATGLPLAWLIPCAMALHVGVTLQAGKPWHPDEHFQILEFAWARAGLAPLADLPWEYAAQVRPTLQPALAMLALKALRIVGVDSPFVWAFALRLVSLVLGLGALIWVAARESGERSPGARKVLWLATLFTWFATLFISRFTSESFGGIALAAGLVVLVQRAKSRDDFVAGALLGFSFVFRFQMAFAIVAAFVWVGTSASGGWMRAARTALAATLVVLAATMVDFWFYGAPVFTPWNYFQVNLIQGVAAQFGVSPWWTYFVDAPLWTAPPFGFALLLLAVAGIALHPRSIWSWVCTAFVAGHVLVAHKELRFLLPLIYLLPLLAARGWEAIPQRFRWRPAILVLGAQNLLLAILLLTPAIHRGKDLDWHYFRALWAAAEAEREPVYVLSADGDPYAMLHLTVNVYRHPRIRAVAYRPGAPLPADVPPNTPPARLLIVTRNGAAPDVRGAAAYEPIYAAEPGFKTMARWGGLEDAQVIRFLERADRWDNLEFVRRVYRVRLAGAGSAVGPGGAKQAVGDDGKLRE